MKARSIEKGVLSIDRSYRLSSAGAAKAAVATRLRRLTKAVARILVEMLEYRGRSS